jgi:hypothetical protein
MSENGVRHPWHYDRQKTYGLTGPRVALLKLNDNGTATKEVSPHGYYQTAGTHAS